MLHRVLHRVVYVASMPDYARDNVSSGKVGLVHFDLVRFEGRQDRLGLNSNCFRGLYIYIAIAGLDRPKDIAELAGENLLRPQLLDKFRRLFDKFASIQSRRQKSTGIKRRSSWDQARIKLGSYQDQTRNKLGSNNDQTGNGTEIKLGSGNHMPTNSNKTKTKRGSY